MKNLFNLDNCDICPRVCKTSRYSGFKGFCKADDGFYVASVFKHTGEEPVICGETGICNVFFAHCNLQCVYCQNYQISANKKSIDNYRVDFNVLIDSIVDVLDTGVNSLGFVSPSHFAWQVVDIVEELWRRGYYPTVVYNTNAYDSVETLKILEKYVDVYLPDLKYAIPELGLRYSKVRDYPQVAFAAVKEMFRQKGDFLFVNSDGVVESGLIIRHLILPNNIENTKRILQFIARELSRDVYISLMSQYYPVYKAFEYSELSRSVSVEEFNEVLQEVEKLDFSNGWLQELDSKDFYRPDFDRDKPFVE